jgi:hypothetical protein
VKNGFSTQKPQLFASTIHKRIHLRCSHFGSRSPRLLTTHHIALLSISFSFKYMHISHLSRRLFPAQGNAIYKKTDIEIERLHSEKRLHLLVCAESKFNVKLTHSHFNAHVFQRAHVIHSTLVFKTKPVLVSFKRAQRDARMKNND